MFWARADSTETLNASYAEIALLLNLPERNDAKQEVIIQAVKTWLQTHQGWLLILDNADEPDLMFPFLPQVVNGHILLTTRATALRRLGIANPIAVETLSPELGALLLLRRAGLLPPDEALEQTAPQGLAIALQITQALDGLPLALDQAGAYLEATGTSLASYQEIYQQHRMDLLQERRGQGNDHPEPVATTWLLSFQRIEERSAVAAELLRLCAFLAPDAIGEELLMHGGQTLGPLLSSVVASRYLLEKVLEVLRTYSLVKRDSQRKTLSVHRLVQSVVRDSLLPETRHEWMQRVVEFINMTFPTAAEIATWPVCEQLLPHALLSVNWIEQAGITTPEAAHLLDGIGYYLNRRGRYEEGMPFLLHALAIREQVLGPEHPDTAQTLSNLAFLHHHQGKYEEAKLFLQRALVIQERVLGTEHADTATSLNALALLYRDQGKYKEAEPLYQQALAIRERVLGPEHPHTAHSLSNLAWLYRNQGKYEEAEQLYKRSLTIRERALGSEHPDTATSLNGLALLYQAQGEYKKAELLYQKVLTIRERVLGPDHPSTAQSQNSLALLYQAQGEYKKAETLFKRALAIHERVLGPDHPDTQATRANLATFWQHRAPDKNHSGEE